MQALSNLIKVLTLETLEEGIFEGKSIDLGLPQVFGGQLVAQAMSAAMNRVERDRHLHSCHIHFLRPANVGFPIIYETDILREGKSFTNVNVNIKQQNILIGNVMLSFQVKERGFEHQIAKPSIENPDDFFSENALISSVASKLPFPLREKFQAERAFDVRIKYPNDPFNGYKLPQEQFIWAKLNGTAELDERLQQCLLAYFSDFHCIVTMLHPHEKGFLQSGLRVATLNHSIFFHRSINFNDWLLFVLTTPTASNARGLTRGEVFNQKGGVIASYQQEGLIRDSQFE